MHILVRWACLGESQYRRGGTPPPPHWYSMLFRNIDTQTIKVPNIYLPYSLWFSAPFNFRPGVTEYKRGWKSLAFFGWPKIKGAKFFQNPSITLKQKRNNVFNEDGRKLKGPKIKGGKVSMLVVCKCVVWDVVVELGCMRNMSRLSSWCLQYRAQYDTSQESKSISHPAIVWTSRRMNLKICAKSPQHYLGFFNAEPFHYVPPSTGS